MTKIGLTFFNKKKTILIWYAFAIKFRTHITKSVGNTKDNLQIGSWDIIQYRSWELIWGMKVSCCNVLPISRLSTKYLTYGYHIWIMSTKLFFGQGGTGLRLRGYSLSGKRIDQRSVFGPWWPIDWQRILPPAPLPAYSSYRPEGRAYASERNKRLQRRFCRLKVTASPVRSRQNNLSGRFFTSYHLSAYIVK